MLELVLGGARSGKSDYAESVAKASDLEVVYIATARSNDVEMVNRIDRHRRKRPAQWITVEQPVYVAESLLTYASANRFLLVDCLTLWLSNVLFDSNGSVSEDVYLQQSKALLEVLPSLAGHCLVVSNEVGMGIVPDNPSARLFRDKAGLLHQSLAKVCHRVVWVAAGLPQVLKLT